MKKLRVAIQMDPLEKLHKPLDSTLYLARAAARRGYELFHYEPQHLRMDIGGRKPVITAKGHRLGFKGASQTTAFLGKEQVCNLAGFDVLLMRQDPPFDLAYISTTHILEHLSDRVKIINDPISVRNAPEKLFATHFSRFMAPTLITREREEVERFRRKHGDIIFKNLHGFAGHGIFRFRAGDENLPALIETLSEYNNEPWMIQKYIPAITKTGDKRIVLLHGEPVGVFTRIPSKGDMRGNMRIGAKPQRSSLTKRDHEICDAVGPVLREHGLFLVGLDVIGDYLTEINVTSPTGLVVADQLAGHKGKHLISEYFWDLIVK